MREARARVVAFSLLAVLVSGAGVVRGDEGEFEPPRRPDRDEGDFQAAPRVDPVETAYLLPPGITLTPKQLEAYQKLRLRTEPALRRALDAVQSASKENDKHQASAEVRRMRGAIRAEIVRILRAGQMQAYREAVQRYQQARQKSGRRHGNRNAHRGRQRHRKHKAHHNGNRNRRPAARGAVRKRPQANKGRGKKPAAWQHVKKKPAAWQKRS